MKEFLVSVVSFVASLFFVILFIASYMRWFVIWLFLSKFKFVKELLGTNESDTDLGTEQPRRSRVKLRKTD